MAEGWEAFDHKKYNKTKQKNNNIVVLSWSLQKSLQVVVQHVGDLSGNFQKYPFWIMLN